MEETEKMTALKKAYAEIILNTAKEAAARIIVSERRAQLFQRDLSETKEEALRIMLRVKQMIDLKVNEDETKFLIQRKRIDELEAQLHEAEDIVSNLRANLYETQAQLEKESRNQQRPLDSVSHHTEETAPVAATNVQQKKPMSPRASLFISVLQPQNGQKTECKSSGSSENRQASSCHGEDNDKTDLTPTTITSTVPGQYRNVCTQRIQACDRKLSNGHHSVCEDSDDNKTGKFSEAVKGGSCCEETTQNNENITVDATETMKDSKAHLRLKRKRAMRQKRNRFGQEALRTGLEGRLAMAIPSKPPATVTDETNDVSVAVTDNDLEVADALILITQESTPKTEIGVTGSDEEKEKPTSPPEKSIYVQTRKMGVIKYTFQRKRKRQSSQSISIDNSNSNPQKDNPMQTTGKEQDDMLNAVMPESSHGS